MSRRVNTDNNYHPSTISSRSDFDDNIPHINSEMNSKLFDSSDPFGSIQSYKESSESFVLGSVSEPNSSYISELSRVSKHDTSHHEVLKQLSLGNVESIEPMWKQKERKQKEIFNKFSDNKDQSLFRMQLVQSHDREKVICHPIHFQERYINIFSKGLPHNSEGYVLESELIKLISAIKERSFQKLSKVRLGGKLKLIQPSASWSKDIVGSYANTYEYNPPPKLCFDFIASEMVELYCMTLARDVPFSQYTNNLIIIDCCRYLNSLPKYSHIKGQVTPYNIFRGSMDGDLQANYISQFMYRHKYRSYLEGYDFMKTWDTALSAQNGHIIEGSAPTRDYPRYIMTGRDLAYYTSIDEISRTYHDVSRMLWNLNIPMNEGIIKETNNVEGLSVDLGRSDLESMLGLVGRSALLAAFYQGWNNMFLRPEALGIEIERIYRKGSNIHNISSELLINPVLEAVRAINDNVLLSQVRSEGAPLCPSTPNQLATVAGAYTTILKFFFNTKYELDVYEPNETGEMLISTGMRVTVDDELNKLASNIGFGCSWAGINYHMDTIKGLKLGEKVAINLLQDLVQRYSIPVCVRFRKFSTKMVTIKK